MNRSIIAIVLAGAISLVFIASASAAGTAASDDQLNKDAAILDDQGANSTGSEAIVQTIESTFSVTQAQIDALRADDLGYGEIVILLSLAQATPAGVTTDNINQILALRQGPPVLGWGEIARQLDLNLGKVVSTVVKATDESAHGLATAQNASENGKGNGMSAGASAGAGMGGGSGRMGFGGMGSGKR